MEQSNAWRSLGQEVGVPELLRTRTRTRRRRRKRAWVTLWAYLLQGLLLRHLRDGTCSLPAGHHRSQQRAGPPNAFVSLLTVTDAANHLPVGHHS
jgi:hypothetical protein